MQVLEGKLTELIALNGKDGQVMTPEEFVMILEREKDDCPFPVKEVEQLKHMILVVSSYELFCKIVRDYKDLKREYME